MSNNIIAPKVGEVWALNSPAQDWYNGIVIAINNDSKFVTAKIISTELPANYNGLNVEINDSFNTNVPTPFVIFVDSLKELSITDFTTKRGQLSEQDLIKVTNAYSQIS